MKVTDETKASISQKVTILCHKQMFVFIRNDFADEGFAINSLRQDIDK